MKWFPILLFVLALVAGYSPQLRTPAPAVPIRHYGIALMFPKTIIRFEIVRS